MLNAFARRMVALSAMALVFVCRESQAAYKVWCGGQQYTATTITSVFGETREVGQTDPTRFHAGVDVANNPCNVVGTSIQPIESGTVQITGLTSCSSLCLRVKSVDGTHAFDYVDVDIKAGIVDGSTVTAGVTTIANVHDLGGNHGHLHLNEIKIGPAGTFRINPQRSNALVFSDLNAAPVFVSTTIGGQNSQVVIVPEVPELEGDTITPVPFILRDNTYFVKGPVDIMVTANAGTSRKGLYQVGAYIQTPGYLFGGKGDITFNSLLDVAANAADVQNIYLWQNPDSNTHFATNFKINGVGGFETQNRAWNTDAEIEGKATLCAYIKNYPWLSAIVIFISSLDIAV